MNDSDPFDTYAYQPTRRERAVMAAYGLAGATRSTIRHTRRALFTMRPTWAPLLAAVLVVTPTAAAMATWATLPGVGGGMRMRGEMRVEAASEDNQIPSGPTPTADPRLQPGYYAAPAGPPDLGPPSFLTLGLLPHWPDIDRAAREHGLDPWAWAAVVVIECPEGVNSRPAPSCQYANGSDAGGLAQVTGGTAATIAAQSGYPCVVDRFDPVTSLRCGAFHFRDLLRATGSIWTPDDELPALQLASIAYNAGAGSAAYGGAKASAASGGDACAGIPQGWDVQTHRYCAAIRDMWGVALAARGAGEPDGGPALPHLEAGAP